MAKGTFEVYEWKIKNFGCWCEALHGKCIQSPNNFYKHPFRKVELYPRGCSGQDDHMKVRFCDVRRDLIGDLALLYSDGSSICSHQLEIIQSVPELSVHLKFEEVIARIEKGKDEITLRFRIQKDGEYEQRMCTTIVAWEISFKMDPKLIESVKSYEPEKVSYFRYTSEEGKGIHLKIARRCERIHLIMDPNIVVKGKAVLVESSLNILTSDNNLVRNEVVKHLFIDNKAWTFSESLAVKEFEERGISVLLRLRVINGEIFEKYNYDMENKNVSIVPNESTISENKSGKCGVTSNQSDDSVTVLTRDLMCLFQDQDFSDFQLKCGGVSFNVHKNIMSVRSPVFKTMLSTDMTESASGQVVVEDLDPSTLSLFLTYLYTGAVEDLECDRALKLYYAADKYQVTSLKGECAKFLCSNVSISNVCDVLTFADHHTDEGLTAVSRDFILNNYNDVLGSENWEIFSENEPTLAVKTLTYFAKKNYVKKSTDLP